MKNHTPELDELLRQHDELESCMREVTLWKTYLMDEEDKHKARLKVFEEELKSLRKMLDKSSSPTESSDDWDKMISHCNRRITQVREKITKPAVERWALSEKATQTFDREKRRECIDGVRKADRLIDQLRAEVRELEGQLAIARFGKARSRLGIEEVWLRHASDELSFVEGQREAERRRLEQLAEQRVVVEKLSLDLETSLEMVKLQWANEVARLKCEEV